jgi:hypothetical protein
MYKSKKRFIIWAPRVLCIIFALFLSIFALDVFSEGLGFWQTILALLIHLIPAFLILIVLIVSWRWELVGGIIFTALGILYLVSSWGRFPWVTYLIVSGPLLLVGVLFLVNWAMKSELRSTS